LNLQQQLTDGSVSNDDLFRSRLSRVVVKLFARVVKAEENAESPYKQGRLDMEALVCSLEDILFLNDTSKRGKSTDGDDACTEMIVSLLQSIVSIQNGSATLRTLMTDVGIDPDESAIGKMLLKCTNTDDIAPAIVNVQLEVNSGNTNTNTDTLHSKTTPSKDVASLVSRLGCTPPGAEREAALESIRAYKLEYGSNELDAHLQQLSGPFREYILEQINREPSPQKQAMLQTEATSVSDRIRNLRSRLQASEMTAPSSFTGTDVTDSNNDVAIEPPPPPPPPPPQPNTIENNNVSKLNPPSKSMTSVSTTSTGPASSTSNIIVPSPSKLPVLKVKTSSISSSSSTSSVSNISNNMKQQQHNLSTTTNNSNTGTPESKIPIPGQSRIPVLLSSLSSNNNNNSNNHSSSIMIPTSSSSAQSLRERLTARQGIKQSQSIAQQQQSQVSSTVDSNNNMENHTIKSSSSSSSSLLVPMSSSFTSSSTTVISSGNPGTALGRAAALRARLEVVKQQQQQQFSTTTNTTKQ
jgi:hypothetical protein